MRRLALMFALFTLWASPVLADCAIDQSGSDVSDDGWGLCFDGGCGGGANPMLLADSFVPGCTGTISAFSLRARYEGSDPADHGYVTIEADSGGNPSGSALATSGNFDVTSSFSTLTPTAPAAAVTNGVTYWIVWRRTSGASNTDYYGHSLISTTATLHKRFNDGAWAARGGDMWWQMTITSAAPPSLIRSFFKSFWW